MLKMLREMGITSDMMFSAGTASVGLSILSWALSVKAEGTPRADRWGIFIGQWAPTFFALGAALRVDETKKR
jgi:hypothetical protein